MALCTRLCQHVSFIEMSRTCQIMSATDQPSPQSALQMKAITVSEGTLVYQEDVAKPKPQAGQVLISVKAAGLNAPDILQAAGSYPPPLGASDILGLECAGVVEDVGEGVTRIRKGDRVCALLDGGGYAEYAVALEGFVMKIPDSLSFESAAAIPETFITCYLEMVILGQLREGQSVLIHGAAGGIGSAATQIAKVIGAKIFVTASSAEKLAFCQQLGADVLINYREQDFAEIVMKEANPDATLQSVPFGPKPAPGANMIVDPVGGCHLKKNIDCLTVEGKLMLIGLPGGVKAELDLASVLQKRLQIIGSTLRARPKPQKAEIVQSFWKFAEPHVAAGRIQPLLDRTYPLKEASQAHKRMVDKLNSGNIVLTV